MMSDGENCVDVAIIGGGPAGLFASFYAGLREMSVKIIEAQTRLGGKINVYPEKMIWDVGGLTPVTGKQLIAQLVEQGLTFDPTVVLGRTVTEIRKNDAGLFELITDDQQVHVAKTVIVAVGGGIIDPMKLEVDNAAQYEKTNLHYVVESVKDFRDKDVLISGGGPSAVDWANDLEPIAKSITLIYRGEKLKGHEAEITKLFQKEITYLPYTEIKTLVGDGHKIKEVELWNRQTRQTSMLSVDAVLVNHGFHRNQELLKKSELQIRLKDDVFIEGTVTGESSVPGIYAAGDILYYPGKLHLIAGAFQDAANAVNQAKLYIDPHAEKVGMVSSHHHLLEQKNKKYLYETVRTP